MRRANRRFRRIGAAVAVTAVTALLLATGPTASADIVSTPVTSATLAMPAAFTFDPDGMIWYGERASGQIRILDPSDESDDLFATVPNLNVDGERGLLGIALHPRYPDRPYVYVYVSRQVAGKPRNQILRYTDEGGSGTARKLIWQAPDSASSTNHNGGHIAFGPDGMLYAVVGDDAVPANSQDRTKNDRGKVLRMTPLGGVPASNPFDNRIFAYGIRNSFGFAFDPQTGHLWESENGPECNDELNRIRRGRNYGWGPHETCSGSSPRNTNRDGRRPVLPERWWTPTIAPTGVAFCERCGLGAASRGRLFMADWNGGRIRRFPLNPKRTEVRGQRVVYDQVGGIFSLEAGPGGDLYLSDGSGIYRLERQ
jgi:glucose/arabinose dehydrogenase